MELGHALDQISEIHAHLAKGEVYRGLRAGTVALTGALAFAAAAAGLRVEAQGGGQAFVLLWLTAAAIAVLLCGGEIAWRFLTREDDFARRRTLRVVGQFAPCVAAGLLVTGFVAARGAAFVPLLPGLWAVLFGLGIFAARPYLPRAAGFVGLFYLAAGAALFLLGPASLEPWGMGGTFGLGQLAGALVLHRDRERTS